MKMNSSGSVCSVSVVLEGILTEQCCLVLVPSSITHLIDGHVYFSMMLFLLEISS